jgi:NADPH-dependent curcumin reductase
MADGINRQWVLSARPEGIAKVSDFALVEAQVPVAREGEVLLRNTLVSVDPYQRNLMGNSTSELPPLNIGDVMPGPTVAIVEESRNPDFASGDRVQTWSGWQDYAVSDGSALRKLDPDAAPVSTALGVLGHTGLAAWLGMGSFLDPAPGRTIVVTAANGSVGSVAAKIAKLRGATVVGVGGGAESVAYLKETLGLDEGVDYKSPDFAKQLECALPRGIDGLFDNVGDYMFEALMEHLNKGAKVLINGQIAAYGNKAHPDRPDHLPRLLEIFLDRLIEMRSQSIGASGTEFPAFVEEASAWVREGLLEYSEEFVQGFEKIPATFLRLFSNRHQGKLIVRIA